MTKYLYRHITGKPITRRQFEDLVKRYRLDGNNVKHGSTTIAYRVEKMMTEAEIVKMEGRF
jgi:hypothetical protein